MKYLVLIVGFVLIVIIISFYFLIKKQNENEKQNEKFEIIQKTGLNKKIYLNPPKNADKYGVLYSPVNIKCEDDNCMIEDFDNPTDNPFELIINRAIPVINEIETINSKIDIMMSKLGKFDNITLYLPTLTSPSMEEFSSTMSSTMMTPTMTPSQ